MPTNEAGLSEGHDQGAGGGVTASDMPAGEGNADARDQSGQPQAEATDEDLED